ncbi:hypothetical protein TNCV_4121741 [Trichonephila clavipes]|nr:hypothetical protein TNCV_4121741 [Trichonephila clavipes]
MEQCDCVDYRKLNAITVEDFCLLLYLDDLLHEARPTFSMPTISPPKGADARQIYRSSNTLPLVWCGSYEREGASSGVVPSFDYDSKLRDPSPKDFV